MADDAFLEIARNLAHFHREHEKFYARIPLEDALALQRISGALRALAERWSTADPRPPDAAGPFSGAEDLNDERAIELAGILFMEGEQEPAELRRIRDELRTTARSHAEAGEWLGSAMETSWAAAEGLLRYPALADLLADRHRIIANDSQAAHLALLVARHLERAGAVLDGLALTTPGVRADLAGDRAIPASLHAACDFIDHAADLAVRSATLLHDNERRWRLFKRRVDELRAAP